VSDPGSGEEGGGILQSLRNLAATLVALLQTRLDLLVTELEEERLRLLQLLFWAAAALLFFAIGLLLLTFLLVVVLWDNYRVAAIVTIAAAFLGLGIYTGLRVRSLAQARPRLLSASLDQLSQDKDELTSR
jgi:uncharacterized membrane protein YqjE